MLSNSPSGSDPFMKTRFSAPAAAMIPATSLIASGPPLPQRSSVMSGTVLATSMIAWTRPSKFFRLWTSRLNRLTNRGAPAGFDTP